MAHSSVIDEAIGDFAEVELEFVASITAPIFWVLRDSNGTDTVKNGSLFFMDAGEGVFAVTASHVVEECLHDTRLPTFVQCMIGGHGPGKTAYIYLSERVIASHPGMDIATLRVSRPEVEKMGRSVLTGSQETWPPRLAEINRGVTYCGFPGNERRWLARRELNCGYVTMAGYATSVHETVFPFRSSERSSCVSLGTKTCRRILILAA